jgi:hypothetical protein
MTGMFHDGMRHRMRDRARGGIGTEWSAGVGFQQRQ